MSFKDLNSVDLSTLIKNMPKIDYSSLMTTPYYETVEYKQMMKNIQESGSKIAQDREDFFNHTRIIAESTVASAKHTENSYFI